MLAALVVVLRSLALICGEHRAVARLSRVVAVEDPARSWRGAGCEGVGYREGFRSGQPSGTRAGGPIRRQR